MARLKGSKNKTKTLQDLIQRVTNSAEEQGKKFVYSLDEIEKNPYYNTDFVIVNQDEDQDEDEKNIREKRDDSTTYECGRCGKLLVSAEPVCPYCGISLSWA